MIPMSQRGARDTKFLAHAFTYAPNGGSETCRFGPSSCLIQGAGVMPVLLVQVPHLGTGCSP